MSDSSEKGRQSWWVWIIPLGLLGLAGWAYYFRPEVREFVSQAWSVLASDDPDRVQEWVSGYGAWGFVVIFGLMLMQTLIPILPSVIAMVAAVLAYGTLLGSVLAWSGMLLAAALGYAIGRTVGPLTVNRLLGEKTRNRVTDFVNHYGLWAVIAARISPVFSTDAVSLVAGLVGMTFWRFLAATALGTAPLVLLIAFLGRDIERLESGLIWLSVVSLAIFISYVIYDRRSQSNS